MLKSVVPSFCSVAFMIGLPSAANPGTPSSAPVKNVLYTSNKSASGSKVGDSCASVSACDSNVSSRSNAKLSQKNSAPIASPADEKRGMKFVNSYIRNNDENLGNVRERSEGPFAIIDSVLHHYGLPLQLKYLAVIESELKPTALSRVGAKGPWQLMPGTAHVLGLKVSRRSDERMNFYKSTSAAAKYLRDLHHEFGDWLLVLAAYNGGPLPVYRAIHKSHSRNFWALQNYLPAESRNHVKKFIATTYYFEGGENIHTTSTPTTPTLVKQVVMPVNGTTAAPARVTAAMGSTKTPEAPKAAGKETDNERFLRLMHESAQSLKASHELLGVDN